ncbi:MAG: PAS domain S-box protein [Methanoregula sp.]|nr:PAS domain S-box protein [Methanoregula sp.]
MQLLFDPVTLVNLILCIVIVILSIIGYVKIRSTTPLFIGAAFFLFGVSHVVTLLGLKTALEQEIIIVRALGYITVWVGVYLVIREIMLRMKTEEELKTERLGLERRVDERTADLQRANEALSESEERYRTIMEQAADAIFMHDETGRILEVNRKACQNLGYSREELLSKSIGDLDPEVIQTEKHKLWGKVMAGEQITFESHQIRKDGSVFPVEVTLGSVHLSLGPIVLGIVRDITERKRAEEKLKHFNEELEKGITDRTEKLNASLEEKVLLLREIHHRVKNNLQIILSLIGLQSQNIKDPHLLDTMGDFQNRIMAMAHVHERMCRTEDISRIDLSEIVTFLGTSLFKSYNVDPQHIRLNVEMKDLQVTLDSAIPISLIISELISNSIKHAFPKGTTGEITIAGRREADTLVLSFKDTGIGIPEDLDWMRSKQSLGHRLMVSLVEQLNGTIKLDRTTGTAFNIVMKEKQ